MTQQESLNKPESPSGSVDDTRSAMEIVVADIVAEALGISEVPTGTSIFALGATSLSVVRICAQLEQATGIKVLISQLFRTPTVAALGAWLAARASGQGSAAATEHASGGLVALTPMQVAGIGMDIVASNVWWIDGRVDPDALGRAATDVHRRHQALHARYVTSGPALGYAILPADPGSAKFIHLPDAETDAAAVVAARATLDRPFRIDEGDVWRCVLISSAASGRSILGVAADHTAYDGPSGAIIARELAAAYDARRAGRAPEFGEPVASLAQIESEYHQQLASTDIDTQRQYWRDEFRGLQPCYFPDRSSEYRPHGTGPVAEPVFMLGPAQLASWQAYGRAKGMTPFVWFAAAYTQALIGAGAPQDPGIMFGIANHSSDLVDRSVTCRVIFAFLRPNGPTRSGSNLLARTHDAYNGAMAALEGRLSHEEIPEAVGRSAAEFPMLQALPHVMFLEGAARTIKLGDASGTVAEEFAEWGTGPADLSTAVTYLPATNEMVIKVPVRIDAYPAELADQIGDLLLEIIAAGPEQLEKSTTA